MRIWKWITAGAVAVVAAASVYVLEPEYAYLPPAEKLKRDSALRVTQTQHLPYYDVWGKTVSPEEAERLKQSEEGRALLSAEKGAIEVNQSLLQNGRQAFYQETFGNEVFLTDILGIVDGAFTIPNVMKAILQLKGEGTSNLRVELAKDVVIGGNVLKKGTKIDTGIDVPKGAYAPLGLPITYSEGRVKVGISCAACHATVDRETKTVVEGAPNSDLNAGLLLALATNSASYFTHAEIDGLKHYLKDLNRTVVTSDGRTEPLPDPVALEKKVDETFANWIPGNFDSTIDLKSNLTQIPDSFTRRDHPYGWSGFAAAGPFRGLSVFCNNVHSQNSDTTSQAEASKALFGIDKEVYLGTILQNAASAKYRFDPKSGIKPSSFLASVDPTPGVLGLNELVASPTYPKVSLSAPDGLFISSPGQPFWRQINGIAAWQNTLVPPQPNIRVDGKTVEQGREVFQRAGCIRCHAGEAFTNNRVVKVEEIGTDGSRAKAFKKTQSMFSDAYLYPPNTPVPLPKGANPLKVPTDSLDREQIRIALAHGPSNGGYKVPSLIGLYWTAPYLHDGGVAVGPDEKTHIGVPGTLAKGIQPDPHNSLRALVDRNLREQVVKANQSSKELRSVHIQGIGHEFWVDAQAGFTKEEQEALVRYLMSLTGE